MILEKEYQDVQAFHEKFNVPQNSQPAALTTDVYNFRLGFLREELTEMVDAHFQSDLETVIDSLIDLVYVSNGAAIMMGFSVDDWKKPVHLDTMYFFKPPVTDVYHQYEDPMLEFLAQPTTGIQQLDFDSYNQAVTVLNNLIMYFINSHAIEDVEGCRQALFALSYNCMRIAAAMGIRSDAWNEFWDDVQRANMAKVRATSVEQSKRKSTLDVIKPEGWVGPTTTEILKKYNG